MTYDITGCDKMDSSSPPQKFCYSRGVSHFSFFSGKLFCQHYVNAPRGANTLVTLALRDRDRANEKHF